MTDDDSLMLHVVAATRKARPPPSTPAFSSSASSHSLPSYTKRKRTLNNSPVASSSLDGAERSTLAKDRPTDRHTGLKSKQATAQKWVAKKKIRTTLFAEEPKPRLPLGRLLSVPLAAESPAAAGSLRELFGSEQRQGLRHPHAQTWISLKLGSYLVRALEEGLHVARPTRVQCLAIPPVLAGRDLFLKSQTGSGKTLAFLVPVVQKLSEEGTGLARGGGCRALILAPTRELALQIFTVLQGLVQRVFHGRMVPGLVMGGEKKKAEKARLRKGLPLLVATPGRLLDHLRNTKCFEISALRFLVLDEADRLLDLGFEQDLKAIITILDQKGGSTRRQTVLVSATLEHRGVAALATLALVDPMQIDAAQALAQEQLVGQEKVGGGKADEKDTLANGAKEGKEERSEELHRLPSSLRQEYVEVQSRHRMVALASFLRLQIFLKHRGLGRPGDKPALATDRRVLKAVVFFSTIAAVELHHRLFSESAWPDASAALEEPSKPKGQKETEQPAPPAPTALLEVPLWKLHGDMPQTERTATYLRFAKAGGGILFCTDVAARGLDLPAVDYIVQFDPPEQCQEYIHRVGRTARMGRQGKAVLFLLPSELGYLKELEKHGIQLQLVPVPSVLNGLKTPSILPMEGQPNSTALRPLPRLQDLPGVVLQRQFIRQVGQDPDLLLLAQQAYVAYTRAYATYPRAVKFIFHPKRLHLGRVAKGFALHQKPTEVATVLKKHDKKEKKAKQKERGEISNKNQKKDSSEKAKKAGRGGSGASGQNYTSRLANAEFG
eukprot:gb/GEZN01002506.1/.p1 GENE.gb/GEZN01002506.1/~~gb/GEZN01002506.1/.p1  ORF type:complete len:780 (-),score=163.54 gb/GEZN01002506.1/:91-2430(-)